MLAYFAMILLPEDRRKVRKNMIYCNLSDDSRNEGIEIGGNGSDVRDELASIFTELRKTDIGQSLIYAALVQCADPEWEEYYNSEIRVYPDPNRRRA